jgi:photosystem II stability/assembly factor-like uncharacterized protein
MINSRKHFAQRYLQAFRCVCMAAAIFGSCSAAIAQIGGINWFPIGPADISGGQTYGNGRVNVSGRASAIAVNPKNINDIWLGTANGGVWHTTDRGAHWLPMADEEASLTVGAIALDGCSANGCAVIYVGTGENAIRRDTYYGMGLLIGQTSGGEIPIFSWTLVGADIFRFASINNVLLDPAAPGTIYVTLSSGVTASATESTVTAPAPPQGYGIFKSTNWGTNWTRLDVAGSNNAKPTDLKMDPTNSRILYAGFMGRGVFRSADGGINWCPLDQGIPRPAGCPASTGLPDPAVTTFDHVELAIHRPNASGPAVLYAVLGNCPDPIGVLNIPTVGSPCSPPLFKTADDGVSWTQVNSAAPAAYSRYTHAIAVAANDPNVLIYGGLKLFKSTNGGQSFFEIGSDSLHPDHHAVVFPDQADLNLLYETSDGGFAISTNGGNKWTSATRDLQISGFQSVSTSPLTARIIGGLQDNGTNMWLGTRVWAHSDDGDAASTQLDLDDVLKMYDVYFNATPRRSTNGGACCQWSFITNGITASDPAAAYPPLAQDPSSPHALYIGSNRLYRSTNKGDFWSAVSPPLGGTATNFPDIERTNVITAIAVAPSNGNRIYLGYYDGQIFATDGACASPACWRAIGGTAKGLPQSVVTRIAVDPGNPDIAYATFSGFSGGAHVFKTTNGGGNWTPAGNGLPSIPTNTVAVENSTTIWVGADDGVYKSVDSGASWNRFGSGLPHAPVYEIAIDRQRGRLFAATHGRGVYVLTQPFLTNFEGWVENDIWDVPVYGGGFISDISTSAGSPCTMRVIQRDGSVCAASTIDAMGGTISFDGTGQLVTSKNNFYMNRPVAFACYNGACIDNKTIATCNPNSNPMTSVTVTCGSQVGIDHILGCPAQANPPSNVLGMSGVPGGGGPGGGGPAPVAPANPAEPAAPPQPPSGASANAAAVKTFDIVPAVQMKDGGTRALCSATVGLHSGDTPADALKRVEDAVAGEQSCRDATVSAAVRGIPPEGARGEDLLGSPATLTIAAPSVVGGQLFTAIHAPPGAATGTCFNLSGLGVPVLNQIAIMKVDLETAAGGAAGGDVEITEQSPIGTCEINVKTTRGQTAAQVAAAIASAFQAPGVPGPVTCPADQNARDVTTKGNALITVFASGLNICSRDDGVGFFVGPEELATPKPRPPRLQYSAKLLCGKSQRRCDDCDDCCAQSKSLVAPGEYFTTVNLHNPTNKPVKWRFKVALTERAGESGYVSRFVDRRLGPDEATEIDCGEITRIADLSRRLHDGFVVVESDIELDIVAVLTAAGQTGKIETLSTERVPARRQP